MSSAILRTLRRLFATAAGSGPADADLLRRFVHLRDEAAFELLVWRHAALVLGVCQGVLRDPDAVEDAFQATFLVLLRKAASIQHTEALAGWLHRVAYRVALRARRKAGPATGLDLDRVADRPPPPAVEEDVRRMLHEEVQRLPAKYRLPVVCCYLEARSHEEAALELGWPKGTVAGRLARARDLLRVRLARRGVTLAGAAVAAELAAGAAEAAAWSRRIAAMLSGLRGLVTNDPAAAGLVSPGAIALAEGVMSAMVWTKMKWVVFGVFLIGATGLTAGMWPASAPRSLREAAERRALVPAPGDEERPGAGRRAEEKPDDPLEEATRRAIVRRSLKMLALAFHNYHDAMNYFPAPAISDAKGRPLLSWRVAILPYIEQDHLYRQFKLDEPWDSPHNKKLLALMPKIFAPPPGVRTRQPYSTYYQLLVGPGAIFPYKTYHQPGPGMMGPGGMMGAGAPGAGGSGPGMPGPGMGAPGGPPSGAPSTGGGPAGPGPGGMPPGMGIGGPPRPGGAGMMGGPMGPGGGMAPATGEGMGPGGMGWGRPVRITDIVDGTSNTILIVEAGEAVPWTKPDDVAYDPRKPLPAFGGQFANVFHVAMADGSVRAFPKRMDQATLRAAISPNGGEIIDFGKAERAAGPYIRAREEAMNKLRRRNADLKEEAEGLQLILQELRDELDGLRWRLNEEKLLALDPKTAELRRENAELEKSLREAKSEARKMMEEIRKMKEEMKNRTGK